MKLQTSSLRSKVARRIFLLFITCALVPVGGLTVLSFYRVSSQLRDQSRQKLEQSAKSQAMSTYERLEMLDTQLQLVALQVNGGAAIALRKEVRDRFSSIGISNGTAQTTVLLGAPLPISSLTSD